MNRINWDNWDSACSFQPLAQIVENIKISYHNYADDAQMHIMISPDDYCSQGKYLV